MARDLADAAADLRRFALSLPEAWEDFPWGESVAKVRKKVFVFLGKEVPDDALVFSVKLPRSALEALELPYTSPTGYGLGKSGWVSVRFPAGEDPPLDTFRAWIEESYRAVAPKTLCRELDGRS